MKGGKGEEDREKRKSRGRRGEDVQIVKGYAENGERGKKEGG